MRFITNGWDWTEDYNATPTLYLSLCVVTSSIHLTMLTLYKDKIKFINDDATRLSDWQAKTMDPIAVLLISLVMARWSVCGPWK